MAKTKKASKENEITLADLDSLRIELEGKAASKQEELAKRTYSVDFESHSNIKRVLDHLNKDVAWTIKNAAMLVNLHDSLKDEKTRLTIAANLAKGEKRELTESEVATVQLTALNLNTLYQALTSVQSHGIESARNYTRLLTNVGGQITTAMQQMAEANKEIQSIHVELAEVDAKISELSTPVPQENEAIEQI